MQKFGIKHVVLMSATILSPRLYCEELGITKDEVGIIRVDSSFDPKKSPIFAIPAGSMNYNDLNKTLPKIIPIIQEILNKYPNEKGIIHTGNYKIAEYIYQHINDNRLLMKLGFKTNEMLLHEHELSTNSVLVSPSLNTGTDLKDDLSRFQIIVKMPFISLGDRRIKQKADLDRDWYICEMLKALVQASGRSTRSESDYSDTYVLDSKFSYWIQTYYQWLPKSFIKRIIWNKSN